MRYLSSLMASSAILFAASASAAPVFPAMAMIDERLDKSACSDVVDHVARYVIEFAPGGSEIAFVGLSGAPRTVATIKIPEKKSFDNQPRARAQMNRSELGKLDAFCDAMPRSKTGGIEIGYRYAAENTPSADAHIFIYANPLSHDEHMPRFSLQDDGGSVPSDGHALATEIETPYGFGRYAGMGEGLTFHIATPGNGWQANGRHGERIERFWDITASVMGSKVGSFENSAEAVLQRLGRGRFVRPAPEPIDQSDPRIYFVDFVDPVMTAVSLWDQPVADSPPTLHELQNAEDVIIGVTWNCRSCDVDLAVQARPGGDLLWYGNEQTTEGQFVKDFGSNMPRYGREIVVLNDSVDLSKTKIGVNWASGAQAGGISGTIRIAIGERVYEHPFSLDAAGDGAHPERRFTILQEGQEPCIHWVVSNALAIINGS